LLRGSLICLDPSRFSIARNCARTDRGTPWQIPVRPPEGGLSAPSFVLCDRVRVFAVERLHRWRGTVSAGTMAEVEDRLRVLLDL
jgi:mRNA-degrading endonuclease toxin of MazEF toxin-antitoxin module